MNRNKKAFTLVELIVVITILAILGTIAFISLQGYSASSRDSVRISDVSSMKTALELFHLDTGKYPIPDNSEEVTYGGDILWYQGTLGTTVVSNLSRSLNKIPTDPISDKEYIFSASWNRNDFQILNLLEGDLAFNTVSQTKAADSTRIPRVDGKYNGIFIKTPNYIFPTPSLITSEPIIPLAGLVLNPINIKSQVTTGGKNIPNIGNINSSTGKLNITLSVYSGPTINSESDDSDKINAINVIKLAYSGSTLAGLDIYKAVLGTIGSDALVAMANTIILNKTKSSNKNLEIPTGGDFTMSGSTSTTSIELAVTCPIGDGIKMYVSGDITGAPIWENCTGIKNITLTSGEETKTISIKFKNNLGVETDNIEKTIIFDIPTIIGTFYSNNFTHTNANLNVNNIELNSSIITSGAINTKWLNAKTINLAYNPGITSPHASADDFYLRSIVNEQGKEAFCKARGRTTYQGSSGTGIGRAYSYESTGWSFGSYSTGNDVWTGIICKGYTYLTSGNITQITQVTTTKTFNTLLLNYTENLNGGTLTPILIINGVENTLVNKSLSGNFPIGTNIKIKFNFNGDTSASPQLVNNIELIGSNN